MSEQKQLVSHKSIVFSGPPASGKGTQCEKIVKYFDHFHISTGDLLRHAVKEGTALGIEANHYMKTGQLVPDQLVIQLVIETLKNVSQRGYVLDGFPRTAAQAKGLEEAGFKPDKIILLTVPEKVLEERVCGRRLDPQTGKIYHINFSPAPDEIKDRLIQRKDDTIETLQTRLLMYHKNISEILTYYHGRVPIVEVNGNRKPDEIFEEVKSHIIVSSL